MRLPVVRPRRDRRLERLPPWRRFHLRPGHLRAVQPRQRAVVRGARTPAGDGGVQLGARERGRHHLQRPQLLLPLREPGGHHGARRQDAVEFHPVRPCPQEG